MESSPPALAPETVLPGERALSREFIAPTARYFRPELDWLRFFAFLFVFAHHALRPDALKSCADAGAPAFLIDYVFLPLTRASIFGVDLFFILSAFLITKLLLLERERTGSVHVGSFYARRILRIWPLYFAFIALVFPIEFNTIGRPWHYYASFLIFMGNWHVVFFGGSLNFTEHLWTVCIEEQFYFVWPLVLRRLNQRRLALFLVAVVVVASLYRAALLWHTWPDGYPAYRNTFARMDCFAVGGILACLLHGRTIVLPFAVRAAMIGMVVAFFWAMGFTPGVKDAQTGLWCYPLVGTACTLCLFCFLSVPNPAREDSRPILSYLGKISYGLYMWHFPILGLTWAVAIPDTAVGPIPLIVAQTIFAFVLTVGVSAISYHLLEQPFLRLKRHVTFVESRPE